MDGSVVTVAMLVACAAAQEAVRTDAKVVMSVNFMVERRLGGVAVLLTSSWAMLLPGSARLNVLLRM